MLFCRWYDLVPHEEWDLTMFPSHNIFIGFIQWNIDEDVKYVFVCVTVDAARQIEQVQPYTCEGIIVFILSLNGEFRKSSVERICAF